MIKFLILLFIPLTVFATEIPLEKFDQSKLENFLRRIKASFLKSEQMEGFVRKHYLYPGKEDTLKIRCTSDYYNMVQIPTVKSCKLYISQQASQKGILVEKNGDEFRVMISSKTMIEELRKGLSYGKMFSHERVHGKSFEGVYQQLFRYSFSCDQKSCEIRAAVIR